MTSEEFIDDYMVKTHDAEFVGEYVDSPTEKNFGCKVRVYKKEDGHRILVEFVPDGGPWQVYLGSTTDKLYKDMSGNPIYHMEGGMHCL